MYIGAVRIAAPTASPPRMRARMNVTYECANAARSEEPRKSIAVSSSTDRRPYRSLSTPVQRLPAIAPQPRLLTAHPSARLPEAPPSPKYSRMNGTTPEITVASKPSRKPPRAATSAMRMLRVLAAIWYSSFRPGLKPVSECCPGGSRDVKASLPRTQRQCEQRPAPQPQARPIAVGACDFLHLPQHVMHPQHAEPFAPLEGAARIVLREPHRSVDVFRSA